ncbi:glycosyltransferase [Microbacterium sp.]|uniref:glycosyltransferase n=1 Tax=Microbacterium sp. TaxID=51671 RepID=UPI003A91631D
MSARSRVRGAVLAPLRAAWRFVLSRRRRLPEFANRWIDSIAENPTSPLGRLAGLTLWTYEESDVPEPVRAPASQPAVLIGPVNYSAQAAQWARSLRDRGIDAANTAIDVPGGYSFAADSIVPPAVYEMSQRWQDAAFLRALDFSHVLIEAERSLFGRKFGRDLHREVAELTSRGVAVAMIAHGTDVRLPQRHAELSALSPYRDPDWYFGKEARDAQRNIALLESLDVPVFVSTPDLIDFVPQALWCPVVIDPSAWEDTPRVAGDGPLRVVHAPTNPRIKGTDLIEPILTRLQDEGIIEYRRITGVPHAEMPALFARSDVVLDQFRLGSYGVAACEAMASGCVTIAHLDPWVRERVAAQAGREVPLVEATPDTLERVLRELGGDERMRSDIARQSREFVRDVHDGRRSAEVLIDNWIGAVDGR